MDQMSASVRTDFVRWSKAQLPFFKATFGAGTAGHFGAFILGDETGVKPAPVHDRTTGDAFTGVFSGNVPTFKEQDFPNLSFTNWFGIVAPAGTPEALVQKLSKDIRQALSQPEMQAKVDNAGFLPTGSTPEAFRERMASDKHKWGKAVAATGFKAD